MHERKQRCWVEVILAHGIQMRMIVASVGAMRKSVTCGGVGPKAVTLRLPPQMLEVFAEVGTRMSRRVQSIGSSFPKEYQLRT